MSNRNEDWDDNDYLSAYLITIRTFGTWLHGDERGSVDRHGKNIYGTIDIAGNEKLESLMAKNTNRPQFLLNKKDRHIVEASIRDVCEYRDYKLHAVNVRSNHVHAVISAQIVPEKVINAIKSYSTRDLKAARSIDEGTKVWSRGGSRQYLWKPRSVALAVEYVLYGQGDIRVDF